MGGHLLAERRHLFRELALRLGAQPDHPFGQDLARGRVEPRHLVLGQLERHGDGTEAGAMQDLVGVGVADAAEQAGIGEGAFQRVVLRFQRGGEGFGGSLQRFQSNGFRRPVEDVNLGTVLGTGFGERERAAIELEGR